MNKVKNHSGRAGLQLSGRIFACKISPPKNIFPSRREKRQLLQPRLSTLRLSRHAFYKQVCLKVSRSSQEHWGSVSRQVRSKWSRKEHQCTTYTFAVQKHVNIPVKRNATSENGPFKVCCRLKQNLNRSSPKNQTARNSCSPGILQVTPRTPLSLLMHPTDGGCQTANFGKMCVGVPGCSERPITGLEMDTMEMISISSNMPTPHMLKHILDTLLLLFFLHKFSNIWVRKKFKFRNWRQRKPGQSPDVLVF